MKTFSTSACLDQQLFNSNVFWNFQVEEFGLEHVVISYDTNLKLLKNNNKQEKSKITDFFSDYQWARVFQSCTGDFSSDVTNHETKLKLPLNTVDQQEKVRLSKTKISIPSQNCFFQVVYWIIYIRKSTISTLTGEIEPPQKNHAVNYKTKYW